MTTPAGKSLKPLLQGAIAQQLKAIAHGMRRTRERLAGYEQRFGMSTAEFERRFDGLDLKENLDYLEWWEEAEALRLLEAQHSALSQAALE